MEGWVKGEGVGQRGAIVVAMFLQHCSRSNEKAGKRPPSQSIDNLQIASKIVNQVINTKERSASGPARLLFVIL